MRDKRRMSSAEFDVLRPFLKSISEDRLAAARLALVDGQTLQGVGNVYGWTRQAVGEAIKAVWKVHKNYLESQSVSASAGTLLPPGWEQVTLIAPSALVARFRADIDSVSNSDSGDDRKDAPTNPVEKKSEP